MNADFTAKASLRVPGLEDCSFLIRFGFRALDFGFHFAAHVRIGSNCSLHRGGSGRSVVGQDAEFEVSGLGMKGRVWELLTKRSQAWRPR